MNFFTGVIERKNGSLLFRAQDGAGMAVVASSREGPVVLGLRPEHISFAPTENSQTRIEALVERVETTGSESLVYLSRGGAVFAARAPANFHAPAGQSIAVNFAMNEARFFDSETGAALP
jgi:multiple sugar transport system ATP-binding protein